MATPIKGRADYFKPGDWNIACSMCGRKRKASEVVRNWQGLYRCPEHNEPRQPQDFVRGIKDVMTVPFAQPESDSFVTVNATFPVTVTPSPLVLTATAVDLLTESLVVLDTELGIDLTTETLYAGFAQVLVPSWVTVVSYLWAVVSEASEIIISSPTSDLTYFQTFTSPTSEVVQCTVTNSLGGVAIATLRISS